MAVETREAVKILEEDIISLFYKNNIIIERETYEYIRKEGIDKEVLKKYVEYLQKNNIHLADKSSLLDIYLPKMKEEQVDSTQEKTAPDTLVQKEEPPTTQDEILAAELDPEVRILKEMKTESEGTIEDFLETFRDRYEKLAKIFKERASMRNFQTIDSIKKGENVKIVGIVRKKLHARTKNVILTVEDLTGVIKVFISHKSSINPNLIFEDEIIGVEGKCGGNIIWTRNIEFPDIPLGREVNRSGEDLYAVLLSDIHVGSKKFMEKEFLRFLKWLNLKIGNHNQRETASKIKYLVVAGDLVDGIGTYPNQKKDLAIESIYDQYAKLSELLSLVPEYIQIILSPGNHDAARPALPQLPLAREFAPEIYGMNNVLMVGNPAFFSLHGVKTLIFHGDTIFDIIERIQVPQTDVVSPMIQMFKKRHLGPMYGKKTGMIPEREDHLIIDDLPDLFHTGHVHVNGHTVYRGTTLINSGTWQAQTEYQVLRNMVPTPCRVPIFNLKTHKTMITTFG
jgi:DNA polymerase II small subunit